jgi:hypothetical protein
MALNAMIRSGVGRVEVRFRRVRSSHFGVQPAGDHLKAPSSNIQAPEKFQKSNGSRAHAVFLGAWFLELLWMLELGIWSFCGPSPSTRLGMTHKSRR